MGDKVVKLSVHKNTLEKRRMADLRKAAQVHLKGMLQGCEPQAIAIVVIDKDENLITWQHEGKLSASQFEVLLRDSVKSILNNEEVTLTSDEEDC